MRRVFKTEYFRGLRGKQPAPKSMGEIAGYRILGLLGTGAGSEVFEVQDPADGQFYALKVVNKRCANDQRFIDQALNEHEVGSRLSHPLIRRSLRVIRQGGGLVGGASRLLLLLELVDGTTLEQRRPRSRRMMIDLFRSVARGLGAMHEAGIVHADMKPINILLESAGGLKIIDFGQSCPVNTVKTRIQGTLDYIAPEQVKRRAITPRTDVYNLGATMYWCVTDHHPPTALRLRMPAGTRQDLADDVLHDPRRYNPHLPAALATLMLDCLRPDPTERPATMRDVIRRLDLALHQLGPRSQASADAGAIDADAVRVSHKDAGATLADPAASDQDLAEALALAALAGLGDETPAGGAEPADLAGPSGASHVAPSPESLAGLQPAEPMPPLTPEIVVAPLPPRRRAIDAAPVAPAASGRAARSAPLRSPPAAPVESQDLAQPVELPIEPPFGDPSEVEELDEDALVAMLQQVNDTDQEIDFAIPAGQADPARAQIALSVNRSAQAVSIDILPPT